MGRPLKGSILQGDQGTWRASVPVRKGARERLERSFTAKTEAKAWVSQQIDRLEAGVDADDSQVADETPAVDGPWTPTEPRVEDPTSFLQNARYWVWDWYVYQHGDPERMRDVWHKIETTMTPFMRDLLRLC